MAGELAKAQAERETAVAEVKRLVDQDNIENVRSVRLEQEARDKARRDNVLKWMKLIFGALFALLLLILLAILIYWLFRWATEEPIIKEVERRVEVPVEKIVEVPIEKIVQKEVTKIPEECTQVRRNGKININCDGVKIEGVPTIGESGHDSIPELIPEGAQ